MNQQETDSAEELPQKAEDTRTVRRKYRIGIIVMALAIIVMLWAVVWYRTKHPTNIDTERISSPSSESEDVRLQARVFSYGNDYGFQIFNDDLFSWIDIDLTVNLTASSTGYSCHVRSLRPRDSLRILSAEFALEDGTRFDYTKTKTVSFKISATISGRRGYYMGGGFEPIDPESGR